VIPGVIADITNDLVVANPLWHCHLPDSKKRICCHWLASDFRQEKLYGVGLDCNPRILDSGVSQFQSGCCQAAVGQSEDELEEDRRFVQNL
jgi:hypothetical protein